MTVSDQPILVTGLPRSGTTWLARELARAPGTALPGREPMNPRAKQFALGGTLRSWTRLDTDTVSVAHRRTLQRVYRGREPRAYSRYGVRQWRAALPSTRLLIKDPFALLSLPLVMEVTAAVPVVLFRHPGALLASYRRMGWTPAVHEIEACLSRSAPEPSPTGDAELASPSGTSIARMAWFWASCYDAALGDTADATSALFVDHAELTRGGDQALRQLMAHCNLPSEQLREANRRPGLLTSHRGRTDVPTLHNFERTAGDVVDGWRTTMTTSDASMIDDLTQDTWARLQDRRLRLAPVATRPDDSTPEGRRP